MTKMKRNLFISLEDKSGKIRGIYDSEKIQLVFLPDTETNRLSSEHITVLLCTPNTFAYAGAMQVRLLFWMMVVIGKQTWILWLL